MFDQDYTVILGAARDGKSGRVVDIDDGSVVAPLALEGMPHLGSGISWTTGVTRLFATPHLQAAQISIIDTATWKTVKTLPTLGPGFFMRSHAATPYAWADVYFGPDRDVMYVLDKRRLEFVRTLRLARDYERYKKVAERHGIEISARRIRHVLDQVQRERDQAPAWRRVFEQTTSALLRQGGEAS